MCMSLGPSLYLCECVCVCVCVCLCVCVCVCVSVCERDAKYFITLIKYLSVCRASRLGVPDRTRSPCQPNIG